MQITIKNVQVNTRLFEETNCFSTTVYVDSTPMFEASNRGTRGPIKGMRYERMRTEEEHRAVNKKISEWIKSVI